MTPNLGNPVGKCYFGAVIRFIVGTRPEAIKMLPILRVLTARKVAFEVITTGQHTDLLIGTGLRAHRSLKLPGTNDPMRYAEQVKEAVLHDKAPNPKWVVVQGDTASAWGACWGSVQRGIPVCHVEAGLRSGDLKDPWPEEHFRVCIDQLALLKCCPTVGNLANLADEGLSEGAYVTGNTIVDALRQSGVVRKPGNHVLVTLHRREAFGEPLKAILAGLATVAEQHPDTPFLWPVHPNPMVKEALEATALPVNVLTRPPLPYHGFLEFLASAKAVLTDSGGVVEEAITLGVPICCARNHAERPEAFSLPWNTLAGHDRVAECLTATLNDTRAEPSEMFGDGHAAERIADLLT